MRAITVAVDYLDLLAITLPYNRHHFDDFMVVTSPPERDKGIIQLATALKCRVHVTDAFYRNNAVFNKWLALEEALDAFGRHDWTVLLDADILWPRKLPEFPKAIGCLYTPFRRIAIDYRSFADGVPPESQWARFRLFKEYEYAGYSQIFHADDRHLPAPPWHETDWVHAGGADSFFQRLWPDVEKIRPPFTVLHLGR